MKYIFLGLGGNQGEILSQLIKCNEFIEKQIGRIVQQSSYYKTKAWGKTNQPDFINSVIKVETSLNPSQILKQIETIEKLFGRDRTIQKKWEQRTMDIDLLFFEKKIIHTKNLIVPHPYLQERNFVLAPFVEIASEFVHPVFNKTILELHQQNRDSLKVEKLNV